MAFLDTHSFEHRLFGASYDLSAASECLAVIEGVGIHTGKTFRLKLHRNPKHQSLVFRVCVGGECFYAPASWSRLSGTARATALVLRSDAGRSAGRIELKTVEHFMAAFHVAGLRGFDAEIEIVESESGRPSQNLERVYELPILDGACADWLKFFSKYELLDSGEHRRTEDDVAWKIIRSFEITDGDRKMLLLPSSEKNLNRAITEYSCQVKFPDAWEQSSQLILDWSQISQNIALFQKYIAPARTFGFEEELKDLEKRGLARGGSMENALLMSRTKVINPEAFCVPNELAAHKLLDVVGDFSLAGGPILGQINAYCAGHSMHLRTLTEAIRKGALIEGVIDRNGRFQARD